MKICEHPDCRAKATFLYSWPGHPLEAACTDHAQAALNLAAAKGEYLELEPIEKESICRS